MKFNGFMMIEHDACLSAAASFIIVVWVGEVGISAGAGVMWVARQAMTAGEDGVEEEGEDGCAREGDETDVSRGEIFGELGEWRPGMGQPV